MHLKLKQFLLVMAVCLSLGKLAYAQAPGTLGSTEEDASAGTVTVEVPVPEVEVEGDADGEELQAADEAAAEALEERLRRRKLEGEAKEKARREGREDATLQDVFEVERAAGTQSDIEQKDVDIMDMDTAGSIDDAVNVEGYFKYGGDIRGAYNWTDSDFRDGDSDRDDDFTVRARLESQYSVTENFRVTGRVAVRCSTQSCDPNVDLRGDEDEGSIENGTAVLDELYVHWFRTERFNVALGRLQTRFVTRGGVFAKSLDRNNSNNTNITYTDGLHATINPGYGLGWVLNYIGEYNDEDGATTTRQEPLSFDKSNSKISHFLALENNKRWGYVIQRGLDITYLPNALQVDGDENGKIEDYWGVVARSAARFPLGDGVQRLQVAGEFGYAPETPTEAAFGLATQGDGTEETDGVAWNVSASVMDLLPGHSVGLLYGRTEAGWLLSPQYGANERQIEMRYSWRPDPDIMIDARLRRRKDLDRLAGAAQRADEWQFYVRGTVRYSVDNLFGWMGMDF